MSEIGDKTMPLEKERCPILRKVDITPTRCHVGSLPDHFRKLNFVPNGSAFH
jgi:hypothetical protein